MRTEQWGQDEVQVWLHPRDDRSPKRWVIVSKDEIEEEQNAWDMWQASLPKNLLASLPPTNTTTALTLTYLLPSGI